MSPNEKTERGITPKASLKHRKTPLQAMQLNCKLSNGRQKAIGFGFISIFPTKTKAVKADFLFRRSVAE